MQKKPKPFKRPPKRFEPKGLSILYEDCDIVVVDKSCGLLTIGNDQISDRTAYFLLNDYVRKGNQKSKNQVLIVHRLDKDTSGVVVFAKTPEAKRYLQDEWKQFTKTYHAVVHGTMPASEGIIRSNLVENSAQVMYSVSDPDQGQLAETSYRVLKTTSEFSLLELHLITGRKNQIRVHCTDQGCPVVGDRKYGNGPKGFKRLMLHASSLTINHPFTKEPMTFTAKVPPQFDALLAKGLSR